MCDGYNHIHHPPSVAPVGGGSDLSGHIELASTPLSLACGQSEIKKGL